MESLEISNTDIILSEKLKAAEKEQAESRTVKGPLKMNLSTLGPKSVKMMDEMTMDNLAFEQRVLQRIMELTALKEKTVKEEEEVKAKPQKQ